MFTPRRDPFSGVKLFKPLKVKFFSSPDSNLMNLNFITNVFCEWRMKFELFHKIRHLIEVKISSENIKITAFVISLLSCLSAGSIMLFSLFSTSLHEVLGLSFFQVNTIASLSALGMYLCNPILGYLADCYGPASLSLVSGWFFMPSYWICAYLVRSLTDDSNLDELSIVNDTEIHDNESNIERKLKNVLESLKSDTTESKEIIKLLEESDVLLESFLEALSPLERVSKSTESIEASESELLIESGKNYREITESLENLLFVKDGTDLSNTVQISSLELALGNITTKIMLGLLVLVGGVGTLAPPLFEYSLASRQNGLLLALNLTANESPFPHTPTVPVSSFHVYSFGIAFAFIGLATSSLYFSSLLTCAKIYPNHKGLAISLPITCYGISSLVGSQLMKLLYFNDGEYLNLNRAFTFFGFLYLIIGVVNFISISVVSIESEVIFEETRLLEGDIETNYHSSENCDGDSLIPSRSIVEPSHHNERFKLFLTDPSAWLLLMTMILNIGPLETFQNNLGSILKKVNSKENLSDQLSVSATASTLTRLAIGGLSDYLASPYRRYPICRVWLLIIVIACGTIGQFGVNYLRNFSVITSLNGCSYGGLFTLYPTIVATIWGVDMMGTTWGSFMVAPAIGSVSYSLIYGQIIDMEKSSYIRAYFQLGGISLLISLLFICFIWKGIWWGRGFKLF